MLGQYFSVSFFSCNLEQRSYITLVLSQDYTMVSLLVSCCYAIDYPEVLGLKIIITYLLQFLWLRNLGVAWLNSCGLRSLLVPLDISQIIRLHSSLVLTRTGRSTSKVAHSWLANCCWLQWEASFPFYLEISIGLLKCLLTSPRISNPRDQGKNL